MRYTSELQRTSDAFLKYIGQNFKEVKPSNPEQPKAHQIKEYTYEVSGGELFQLIQKGIKLVLFCDRDGEDCLDFQTGTWRSIVQRLPKNLKIGKESIEGAFVDCGLYTQLCHSYSANKNPYILLLDNGQEVTRFLAQAEVIVIDQILASIEKRLKLMIVEKENKDKPKKVVSFGGNKDEMYAVTTESQFNALATPTDSGFVFVKFFAPWCGHCKKLEPSWIQLSKEFNSKDSKTNPEFAKAGNWPKISRVDCTVPGLDTVCKAQNIKGYPTLRLFHNGVMLVDFSGTRQLDFLKRWLLLQVVKADPLTKLVQYSSKNIGEITSANFKTFSTPKTSKSHSILYYYTPWCENCKEVEPVWEVLGENAESSKLDIGKIDCTEHRQICIDQGVQGYPAFMMYQGGRVLGKYTGKRSVVDFVKFVNEFVSFELVEKVEEKREDEQCSMDKPEDCADSTEKTEDIEELGEKSEKSESDATKVSDDEISTGSVENEEISTEAPEQPKTTQKNLFRQKNHERIRNSENADFREIFHLRMPSLYQRGVDMETVVQRELQLRYHDC
jgi:thioredoxin-like negative regulator of GroEL